MHRQFGHIRVGLSGWLYPGWRGVFCPKGLRHKDELAYASRRVDTIEINGTFYSLQRPELFAGWREATPDGFVFAVKGGRFITHMKRLRKAISIRRLPISSPRAYWRCTTNSGRF